MKNSQHICIIGAGAMGGAIAGALAIGANKNDWKITVIARHMEKLEPLKRAHRSIGVTTSYKVLADASVVIVAVKPQSFDELAGEIAPIVNQEALLISVMAGRSITSIAKKMPNKRIVRAMPNLGAQFFESMTIWTGSGLTKNDSLFTKKMLGSFGEELCVASEDAVDKSTAVSASGVGFFAYIVEAYIRETESLGFSYFDAERIVLQTLKATNTILQKKEKTPEQLRVAVTSKGGTTEAGLSVLMGKSLGTLLQKTFKKAYQRAKALAR
ncbi:MAG: pyrroline-5-carboxylate reductase dimerization domain-containing protein [bacterium]